MHRSRGAMSQSPQYGPTYRHVLDITMEVKGGMVQDGRGGRETRERNVGPDMEQGGGVSVCV